MPEEKCIVCNETYPPEEWIKYLNKTKAHKVWLKNLEEGIYPKKKKDN